MGHSTTNPGIRETILSLVVPVIALLPPETSEVFYAVVVTLLAWAFVDVLASGKLALARWIFVLYLGYVAMGLWYTAWGAINGAPNPAIVESLKIYVVEPTVYVGLVHLIAKHGSVRGLSNGLVVLAIIITFVLVAVALQANLPAPAKSILLWLTAGKGGDRLISLLVFLVPFVAVLVITGDSSIQRNERWIHIVAAIALYLGLFFGGIERRSVWLAGAVGLVGSAVVALVARNRSLQHGFRLAGLVVVIGLGGLVVYLSPWWNLDIMGWFQDPGDEIRREQAALLWQDTGRAPVFGTGFGVSAPSYVRSEKQPWHYELSYLKLMLHTGVVGVTGYAVGVLLVLLRLGRAVRSELQRTAGAAPYMVALAAVLIAQATNPYFESFKSMWMFFIPLAVANKLIRDRRNRVC